VVVLELSTHSRAFVSIGEERATPRDRPRLKVLLGREVRLGTIVRQDKGLRETPELQRTVLIQTMVVPELGLAAPAAVPPEEKVVEEVLREGNRGPQKRKRQKQRQTQTQ
jgi:hypothetical protein